MRSRAAKAFSEFYEAMRKDIYVFCRAMNYDPSPQHRQLLDAVQAALKKTGPSKIAVKSGQGPGKTKCSGIVGLYLLLHNPYTKLLLTAPTMRQCKDAWLGEVKQSLNAADPMMRRLFTLTGTGIGVLGRKPSEWGALLLTATRSENLQGQHRKDMHLIVEEASGVPRELIEQFKGTLCVVGDTEIYDPSRGRVLAKDYLQGSVSTLNQSGSIESVPASGRFSGVKECVSISLTCGQHITLTLDHPVLTGRGWVKAGEVLSDDLVATPRRLPAPETPHSIPDDHVSFIAYMLTDGSCRYVDNRNRKYLSCRFAQVPGPVLDDFVRICGEDHCTVRDQDRHNNKAWTVAVRTTCPLRSLLDRYGLSGCLAKHKRVPAEFLALPDEQVALLINRMWSCDGSFHDKGPRYSSASEGMIHDLQTLLLRLGITSSYYKCVSMNPYTGQYDFDIWQLSVTGKENISRWKQTVGDVLGKESNIRDTPAGDHRQDIVPVKGTELKYMLNDCGPFAGRERSDAMLRFSTNKNSFYSRERFALLCETLNYTGKHRWLANSDVRWCRIKSIELVGKHPVYDLHVPPYENFVANNTIIHNSNPNALFIQIGNPNTRESQFFDCFNSQSHKWKTLTWSAEDTPASEWFDPQRNVDLEEEFGRDSDVYRVRVLGEFPDTDPNCVMSSDDLEICGDRKLLIPCTRLSTAKTMGIDFARFGGDESTIYRRSGEAIVESFVRGNIDPNDLCDKAFDMQRKAHWKDSDCWYIADAGGMGQGVMGNFHRANKRVTEFHNGGSPTDRQYANKITQAYFEMAKKVRRHEMYLPKDHVLIQQLSSRQYHTNAKGKLILESKDVYMKRHELSPDRADGIVLAMWDHRQANATISRRMEESSRRVGSI